MSSAVTWEIREGDALTRLREMPDRSVHCIVTSPPYWGLRDYGVDGQLGLEETPEEYVTAITQVFREARRVLRDDGTLWLNLGDSYAAGTRDFNSFRRDRGHVCVPRPDVAAGLKPKDLVGIPWRVAFALQADGWYLRSDIVWHKPNPMPESVRDRPTKSHEYVFLFSKSQRYYYDAEAIRERSSPNTHARGNGVNPKAASDHGGVRSKQNASLSGAVNEVVPYRNARSVWTIPTEPYAEAHFATFPTALASRCVRAGCPKGGTVLDPFAGSGTTVMVAVRLGRSAIGLELKPKYATMARRRVLNGSGRQPVNGVDANTAGLSLFSGGLSRQEA